MSETGTTLTTSPDDPSVIPLNTIEELHISVRMLRTWIPEVFPTNALGQMHFVRSMTDSVATLIERHLAEMAAHD